MPTHSRGFELGLLPEKPWNWRSFAAGYGTVTGLILLMIMCGILMPDTLITASYRVIELVPRPTLRPEKRYKQRPQHAELLPAKPVFQTPKLIVPREVRALKPQQQEIEPPKVVMNNFAPAVLKVATSGARPVLVNTGQFQGSSVKPTVNAPISKVQTGGFGDPNGLKPSANSKPNGKLIAATSGSFDMPIGPGQGNGSGGAKGIKGTVASADFGDGVATPSQGDGRRSGRGGAGVQSSGFGSQEVGPSTGHVQRVDSGPPTTSVEITFKPNPVYTDEARHLQLEGEVLLEVEFAANGQLHVNRVVRGLGHGLDEAAVNAANKMRFKPALRNGQAIDSTAIVHVVFQMAY
jgi:TonB family protein